MNELFTSLTALITKALPSDEQRLQQLQLHSPKIFAMVRKHILMNAFRYLKHHKAITIDEYVKFVGGGLTSVEQQELENMLQAELNNNPGSNAAPVAPVAPKP